MADTIDDAQELDALWQEKCRFEQNQKKLNQRQYKLGDFTDCIECGEEIYPEARLKAGYLTCIYCARELEEGK